MNDKTSPWKEHIITQGPDVHFRVADLNKDGEIEIVATEFFGKKLSLIQKINVEWERRVLDDSIGKPFDVAIEDINADGKVDLLVTNHENNEDAGVFAYEIPDNLKDNWRRHTLYKGFKTIQKGAGQGSPGEAMAIHPNKKKSGKPVILVSGDGTQNAHILRPQSQNSNDWIYSETSFLDAGCTRKMAANDVDGDGWLEIFVPVRQGSSPRSYLRPMRVKTGGYIWFFSYPCLQGF